LATCEGRLADCQSAIQQINNLRYDTADLPNRSLQGVGKPSLGFACVTAVKRLCSVAADTAALQFCDPEAMRDI
jgi:hypothetical protein